MKIEMTNKRFGSAANVLPEDVETWEAAGWVVVPKPKSNKKDDDK